MVDDGSSCGPGREQEPVPQPFVTEAGWPGTEDEDWGVGWDRAAVPGDLGIHTRGAYLGG